jgi:hypothetical protein
MRIIDVAIIVCGVISIALFWYDIHTVSRQNKELRKLVYGYQSEVVGPSEIEASQYDFNRNAAPDSDSLLNEIHSAKIESKNPMIGELRNR